MPWVIQAVKFLFHESADFAGASFVKIRDGFFAGCRNDAHWCFNCILLAIGATLSISIPGLGYYVHVKYGIRNFFNPYNYDWDILHHVNFSVTSKELLYKIYHQNIKPSRLYRRLSSYADFLDIENRFPTDFSVWTSVYNVPRFAYNTTSSIAVSAYYVPQYIYNKTPSMP